MMYRWTMVKRQRRVENYWRISDLGLKVLSGHEIYIQIIDYRKFKENIAKINK